MIGEISQFHSKWPGRDFECYGLFSSVTGGTLEIDLH
jgi:hypothetical protein